MTDQKLKHIVDDDNNVLTANLTTDNAERELCRWCDEGVDAFLTDAFEVTGYQVHYYCAENGWIWIDGVTYAEDQFDRAQQLMYQQQQAAKIVDHKGQCICSYVGTNAERQMTSLSDKRVTSQ